MKKLRKRMAEATWQATDRTASLIVVVGLIGTLICLAGLASTMPGCALMQERSSLRTAVDTYATTLSLLAEHRAAGDLSDETVERIDVARVIVRQALDDWREALETDKSPSRAIGNFTEAMTVLIEARLAAEGGE